MNGFFSDTQTKQKAYDRYYNAMSKNDFVQGKKLKALIQRESLDDASTDSLANLFQQRAAKRAAHRDEDLSRKLFEQSDDEQSSDDEEIKEEKRLRGLNAGIKKFILTISTATKVNLQQTCMKVSDINLETLSSSEKARTILKTMLLNRQGSIK
ncbi:unnamed protein product [Phytophthora lilii]|uniref:Unnamed protein product n=1 Tax=Phytophthora lilii TaxID=2077276 RepID=A0A9W6TZ49_9STRA|nr:unnamed protein product [Phytophthora lilii]